jgi:uncharacterized protein
MKLRRWLRSLEPRVLHVLDRKWLAWSKPWMDSHDLLSFQRHPLAIGVAIGLALGVIPTQIEVFIVIALCILFRGNIVAAIVVGWYNNPFTILPLYMLAYWVGDLVLPGNRPLPPFENPNGDWWGAFQTWSSALGTPLMVGLPIVGLVIAAIGYAAVHLLWRWPVWKRAKRMRGKVPSPPEGEGARRAGEGDR